MRQSARLKRDADLRCDILDILLVVHDRHWLFRLLLAHTKALGMGSFRRLFGARCFWYDLVVVNIVAPKLATPDAAEFANGGALLTPRPYTKSCKLALIAS